MHLEVKCIQLFIRISVLFTFTMEFSRRIFITPFIDIPMFYNKISCNSQNANANAF